MSTRGKIPRGAPNTRPKPDPAPNRRPAQRSSVAQPKAVAAPPPVYRPEQKKIVQPKGAAGARTRQTPEPPPAYRPHPAPGLLQAKKPKSESGGASPRVAVSRQPPQTKATNHSTDLLTKRTPTLHPAPPPRTAPRGPNVVQRATVSLVVGTPTRGAQSNVSRGRVIQRATVHAHIGAAPALVFTELTNMMAAVGGGAATGGAEVALAALIAGAAGALPVGNQDTIALATNAGGNQLAVGSVAFQNAVAAQNALVGAPAPARIARGIYHGEMAAVHAGFAAAVAASQNCCIFCYGYLALNGIPHQALRAPNPFPHTQWSHPVMGFRLSSGAQHLAVGIAVRIHHAGVDSYWQVH